MCFSCVPGGYEVGEKVFFAGQNQTFPNGDKLVHCGEGEVVGPATDETHKGKGVKVLFPGNKGTVNCCLTQVRRLRAASAATPPCLLPTHATLPTPLAPALPHRARAPAPQPPLLASPRAVAQRPGSGMASDAPRGAGVRPERVAAEARPSRAGG